MTACGCAGYFWGYSQPGQGPVYGPGFAGGYGFHDWDFWGGGGGGASNVVYAATFPLQWQTEDMENTPPRCYTPSRPGSP